jgi:hypothetical protein
MDYLSVKSAEKREAEEIDGGGGDGGGKVFSFPYVSFLPAFKKQQFSQAKRQGEQIKVRTVRVGEEVTGKGSKIRMKIAPSFQTSQLHVFSLLHIL